MSNQKPKFLLTQTLLGSWQYYLSSGDSKDFIKTLKREPIQQTQAMRNGNQFEGMIQAACEGHIPEETHEWYKPVMEIAQIVQGSVYQAKLYRDIEVDGISFLAYGVLDFLKCGVIYDTKFSTRYSLNKYFDSPQHPMYFYLCPEARRFTYLISDGKYVYKETYYPEDTVKLERIIKPFMDFLDKQNLVELYTKHWMSK